MSGKMRSGNRRSTSLTGGEVYMKTLFLMCASVSIFAVIVIFLFIFQQSFSSIKDLGFRNLFLSARWLPNLKEPLQGSYGMAGFIWGTVITTLIALVIGAPLGIGTAIFIDQIAPKKVATIMRRGIELLAGIPSVIIGWFGLTLLVPFLARVTGTSGYGILPAALVLVVMVLPTITTLSAESLRAVPQELKEAAAAMGSTPWQSIYRVLMPAAREGLLVATILGMGRAIGETMAVQMVVGNARQLAFLPFERTSTMTSRIVTDMGEATGVFRSALFAQALVLLVLAMLLILAIRIVTRERRLSR